jgi:hypothetical protein
LAFALGYALVIWAMYTNQFFSRVVQIQTERGHTADTDGPYRYVRHPGYIGTILFELAFSTFLASWWAIITGGLSAILFVLRADLEDRTLKAGQTGYVNDVRQVRYRLIPGIWWSSELNRIIWRLPPLQATAASPLVVCIGLPEVCHNSKGVSSALPLRPSHTVGYQEITTME